MKLKNYKDDLLERLSNPKYAAGYLEQALAENDKNTFLLALKNVIDANGGVAFISEQASFKRQSVYKALSKQGNPRLDTLQSILNSLGLRISICCL